MNAIGTSRAVRLVGATAVMGTAFAGVGVVAASSASAATPKPVVISAPSSVAAGQEFTLKCNIKPKKIGKLWKNSTAVVHEKGLPIHASRVVGSNGACSMKLILNATGKHKLRVVVVGPQNYIASKWINVHIK